jgi:hypothetical protein
VLFDQGAKLANTAVELVLRILGINLTSTEVSIP